MTDEDIKASDLVEAAINQALPQLEDYDPNDILMDWVVVAFVANPDEGTYSGYPMLFSNGDMPVYRAIGLLSMGLQQMKLDTD